MTNLLEAIAWALWGPVTLLVLAMVVFFSWACLWFADGWSEVRAVEETKEDEGNG